MKILTALLAGSILYAATALGDSGLLLANNPLSREQAIAQAKEMNGGGKVLGVREKGQGTNGSYEIKLISNGKVRVFVISK